MLSSLPCTTDLTHIGDTVHCKHQQATTATPPPSSPEWIPGDDRVDLPAPARSLKSQRSLDIGLGKRSSRLSRRWPSISSRWRDRWPTTSLSSPTVQSAPPSRASSAKSYSVKQSLVNHLEPRETILFTGPSNQGENSRPSSPTLPQPIDASTTEQREPIDRQGQASTPLLPPALTELRNNHDENFQSPLQSPSIATPSTTATFADAPLSSPATTYSPSLSAKPSYSSIYRVHSNRVTRLSADIFRPEDIEELDYWTMKLGHANFHISPEPYMPEKCDRESCNRLLADWETARIEYMKQAIMISGEYGVASETYRLTSEKWAEIDRQWQENLNQAKADAEASGERPHQESLAETQTVCRLPSLPFDPANPEKFPSTNEGGIVGPMVQYAKVQRSPSKKNNFLKLFLDPTSLFGGRSPFGSRR